VTQLALGGLLALAIAAAAYRSHSLTRSGALAAFAIGTATFSGGGWQAALVLFAFFLPSSLLSRIGRARKRELVDIGKHGARDAWQVLANGGIAAVCVVLALRYGTPFAAAFAGAFAAASADTWGTEIGTLARGTPRSILTLRPLATGLSGGVTLQGTVAEFGGAALVALVAWTVHVAPFAPVFLAGVGGAFVDSLLGATVQALRWCPTCERVCETNPHVCGTVTTLRRGATWFDNDVVNVAATLTGAVVAFALK
jgi:uncharacterized protein (TIGR00297 family)